MKRTFSAVPAQSQRTLYENKYRSARYNLLAVVAFTLINIVIAAMGGGSYFLFSAAIPYQIAVTGLYFTGHMPADWYYDWGNEPFLDNSFLIVTLVIAALIIAVFALCFFLSKKRSAWMIVALVLFSLDCAYYLLNIFADGIAVSGIIDILFHGWVMYYLIIGVNAAVKLKTLPPDPPTDPSAPNGTNSDMTEGVESSEDTNAFADTSDFDMPGESHTSDWNDKGSDGQ